MTAGRHQLSRGRREVALAVALICALAMGALARVLATRQPVFSDEFVILGNLWEFIQHRTIIPEHTQYPALYSYMTAPVTAAFFAASVLRGMPPSIYDMSEWSAYAPEAAMWPARLVSVACWCVCAWAVYRLAAESLGRWGPGLLAAAAFGAALGTLEYSGYGLPDVAMTMWLALALVQAARLARREHVRRSAVLAGLFAGLAMATKYTATALALPLLVASLLAADDWRIRVRLVGIMVGCAVAAFLVGCPGWLLAPGHYWQGLEYERAHMARGHLGMMGVPVLGQLELLVTADPAVTALAALGLVLLLVRGRSPDPGRLVLAAAAVAVFAMAAPARKQSLQYLFGLYPVLAVVCGVAAGGRTGRGYRWLCAVVLVGSAACGLFWGYRVAMVPDSLTVARQWLNAHLPDDAVVSVDWIDVPRLLTHEEVDPLTEGLRTERVRRLYAGLRVFTGRDIQYTEAFLRDTDADWLVTSSTAYARFFEFGRFTRLPPPPGSELAAEFEQRRRFYQALFEGAWGWEKVHEVSTGNGPTVRVFARR